MLGFVRACLVMFVLFCTLPVLAESEIGGVYKTKDGSSVGEDIGNLNLLSPNKTLRLVHRVIQGKSDRKYDHESRVENLDGKGNTLGALDLTSPDNENGYVVERVGWSPDSKFVVFSTYSSGGHSPWNSKTFFYSSDLNCFGFLDSYLNHPVVDPNFRIVAPATIHLKVMGKDSDDHVSKRFELGNIVTGAAKIEKDSKKWLKTSPVAQCGF